VAVKKRSPDVLLGISLYAEDNPETGRPYYDSLYMSNFATIQVKGDEIPVLATTASGAERARLWSLMTEVYPAYDDYQRRTDREIPVVVFTRA